MNFLLSARFLVVLVATECIFSLVCAVNAQIIPIPPRIEGGGQKPSDKAFPEVDALDPLTLPGGYAQFLLDNYREEPIIDIRFSGNGEIKDDTISKSLQSFIGQVVSRENLISIEEAINSIYEDSGLLGKAFLSPESSPTPDGLKLHLQVIEVKLTKIDVSGAGRLTNYVERQFTPLKGEIIDSNKLFNRLRFLLLDERVDDLTIDISTTNRLEQRILAVSVDPSKEWSITGLLNNGRSQSVGSFERGMSAQQTNLLGFGDKLSINYRNTDGSNIAAAGYEVPISNSGGKAEFDYLYGNTKLVAAPFEQFDIKSKTQQFALKVSQPVLRTSSDSSINELILGLGVLRTENEDSILGTPFPVTKGADINGRIRSTRLDFSQLFTRRTRKNQLFVSSILGFGLGIGTTNNPTFGDGSFFKWNGQGLFAQEVADRFFSISGVELQLADTDLIGNEQFALGGRGSVRGFNTNQLARSNGLNLSQELRFRAFETEKHQFDISAFFDFGAGWNDEAQINEDPENLASIGLGLTYQFEGIRAAIEYGIPIFGQKRQDNSLQGEGLMMSLQYTF